MEIKHFNILQCQSEGEIIKRQESVHMNKSILLLLVKSCCLQLKSASRKVQSLRMEHLRVNHILVLVKVTSLVLKEDMPGGTMRKLEWQLKKLPLEVLTYKLRKYKWNFMYYFDFNTHDAVLTHSKLLWMDCVDIKTVCFRIIPSKDKLIC